MVTPQVVQNKVVKYTTVYDKFKGVDFSVDPSLVDKERSPDAPNLISGDGNMPEKRPGWRVLHKLTGNVNGLFKTEINSEVIMLAHIGTSIYKFNDATIEQIHTGVADKKSTSFYLNNKLYIMTGEEILSFDGSKISSLEPYIPTILISRNPTGGGTIYESVNLIGSQRIESFLGNSTDKVFQLSANQIKSVDKVEVLTSGEWVEYTKVDSTPSDKQYSVDLATGKITFNKALVPEVTGMDNVKITYTKEVEGYSDRIMKCTIASLYGVGGENRVFVSGNPEYKSRDWHSQIYDATYWPDLNYSIVGSEETAIMGYAKFGKYQLIIKEESQIHSTIYKRLGSLNEKGEAYFSLEAGVTGVGAIAKHSFSNLIDEPLFLSSRGIYAVATINILADNTVRNRSYFIDNRLRNEAGLDKAISCEWNGYYLLCLNNVAYILDSKQLTTTSRRTDIDYSYECYYWTNIPAKCLLPTGNELYFGTEDGRICKFNTDIQGVSKFNDDGKAIKAYWSTKNDDDGATYRYKTMQKKGGFTTLKPMSRSSAKIYAIADGNGRRFLKSGTMDVFDFGDVDFERFTFNTNDSPQEIFFKVKIKNYKRLQFIVENDEINEGFGIFQIVKTYKVGSYAKK